MQLNLNFHSTRFTEGARKYGVRAERLLVGRG